MEKENFFRLGHISKPFGIRGEMFLFIEVDLGNYEKIPKEIFLNENGIFAPRKVKKISSKNKTYLISFEGVSTRTQAEAMQKKEIFLPNDFLPRLNTNEFYHHEIPGCKVIDKKFGEVGIALKIENYPSQQILVVKREQAEILIPFNSEFFHYFDRQKKIIEVYAPEGLIELYLSPPTGKE